MAADTNARMLLIYDIRTAFLKLGLPHEMNKELRSLRENMTIHDLYLNCVGVGEFSYAMRFVLESIIEARKTKKPELPIMERLYEKLNVEFFKLVEIGQKYMNKEIAYADYIMQCRPIQTNVLFDTVDEFTNAFNSIWQYLRK